MNTPKTVSPRRLKRFADYHTIQIRLDPLLWAMVKQTAHQRGLSVSRLLNSIITVGLSSNPERGYKHER